MNKIKMQYNKKTQTFIDPKNYLSAHFNNEALATKPIKEKINILNKKQTKAIWFYNKEGIIMIFVDLIT